MVQHAWVLLFRLRHLVVSLLQEAELSATLPSPLGHIHRGDKQQGNNKPKRGRCPQQPALGVAGDRLIKHGNLNSYSVLPHQVAHHRPPGGRQHKQEEGSYAGTSNPVSAASGSTG
jgi:hypothetical protein